MTEYDIKPIPQNAKFKILTGMKFHRLTVLGFGGSQRKNNRTEFFWITRCDCGNNTRIRSAALTQGNTKSCGCWKREQSKSRFTTHGMTGTPEYRAFHEAKRRCNPNSKRKDAHRYVKRGIEFRLTDPRQIVDEIGFRPSNRHSIDRIDNSGHYEPGNIKWSTQSEQCNNQERTTMIECRGKIKAIGDWAKISKINPSTIRDRINKFGWDAESAIFKPPRKAPRHALSDSEIKILIHMLRNGCSDSEVAIAINRSQDTVRRNRFHA